MRLDDPDPFLRLDDPDPFLRLDDPDPFLRLDDPDPAVDGGGGSPGGREDDARVFKVFVADLSIDIQEDELQTIFGSHGKVMDVKIMDYHGSSKCAFVTYETEDAAKSANQMMNDEYERLLSGANTPLDQAGTLP